LKGRKKLGLQFVAPPALLWNDLPMTMTGGHDAYLVILSIVVAILASFTALSLGIRVRAAQRRGRWAWLAAAAVALGGGIWSMHFIAMLAFSMPGMPVSYEWESTLGSLALAVGFTGLGLAVFDWHSASRGNVSLAGGLIATGVVAMHYVGMSGMQMAADISYDWRWVVGAAITAVWLAARDQSVLQRVVAAVAMGLAISGMHYTAMQGASFALVGSVKDDTDAVGLGQSNLAVAISILTIAILAAALAAAQIEKLLRRSSRREARAALRVQIADRLNEGSTVAALNSVAELVGEHFGVVRSGFGDLDPHFDQFDYGICWTNGRVPPLLGQFPASAFGEKIVAALQAGKTVAIDDLLASSLSDEARTHSTAREVDTRAILVVPYVREGQLRSIVYLNDRVPRPWRHDEIQFLEEIAERVRLLIERRSAEEQLRELNATLEARVEARTSELARAEIARREADALHSAYFENTPDPLFVVSVRADGAFVAEHINPAHEQGVGFQLAEIRGKRVEEFLPPDAADRIIESYRRVVATRKIYSYRDTFNLLGKQQHWDTTLIPICDQEGLVTRIIGSSRDMTKEVAADEVLRQSQKMEAIGQLTSGIAHDFNNLLMVISGGLDMFPDASPDKRTRLTTGMRNAVDRGAGLCRQLLSFSRRKALVVEVIDVEEQITGMSALLDRTLRGDVDVETRFTEKLWPIEVDPAELELVLLNLCVNARDAMPDGGKIIISGSNSHEQSAELQGDFVRLQVIDNGTGISPEVLTKVFEPFFTTKDVGKGSGMGLAQAYGFAKQSGGTIRVDSTLGSGTTMELLLPRSKAPLPVKAHRDDENCSQQITPMSAGNILLVEDDEEVAVLVNEMLCHLGFSVTRVSCAEAALGALANERRIDAIFSDIMMPGGMNGLELAREIRRRRPELPILLTSGYAGTAAQDAEREGISILFKPYEISSLAAALTAVRSKS
jgi:PAS domain S-box-containing protein